MTTDNNSDNIAEICKEKLENSLNINWEIKNIDDTYIELCNSQYKVCIEYFDNGDKYQMELKKNHKTRQIRVDDKNNIKSGIDSFANSLTDGGAIRDI